MNGSFLDKLRGIMQWGFLAALVIISNCTNLLKGMHALVPLFIFLIVVANFFFGKLFCSHLCPAGLLSEIVFKLKRKIIGKRWGIRRWSLPDNILRSFKYLSILILLQFDIHISNAALISIVIATVVIGGIFDNMFFCKYFCFFNASSNIVRFSVFTITVLAVQEITANYMIQLPISYIVAIGGYCLEIYFKKAEYNISLLHVHRDVRKCTGCGDCIGACPFSVDVPKIKRVVDIDCNLCGECVRECRHDALKMGICNTRDEQNRIRGIWFAPLATAILVALAFYALVTTMF